MKTVRHHQIIFMAIVLASFLSVSRGLALIGETPEQSEARYGPPIKSIGETKYYKKSEYLITAHFLDGITDAITYVKFGPDKNGLHGNMAFEEIAILLDNNSKGEEWKDLAKGYDPDYRQKNNWECKKYQLQAYYDEDNRSLYIGGRDYGKLEQIASGRSTVNHEKLINTLGI